MTTLTAPLPASVSTTPSATATLDRLAPGCSGVITAIAGLLPIRRRLLEMGLCQGTPVEVRRRAPLGDPIELDVRGYLLSLRKEQAALIRVTV
jgi:Fe2+ transport system protein FeoA